MQQTVAFRGSFTVLVSHNLSVAVAAAAAYLTCTAQQLCYNFGCDFGGCAMLKLKLMFPKAKSYEQFVLVLIVVLRRLDHKKVLGVSSQT